MHKSESANYAAPKGDGNGAKAAKPSRARPFGIEDFTFQSVVGEGAYGRVLLVECVGTSKLYAMKSLKKASVQTVKQLERILTERNVLEVVIHPFIVRMHYAFQTNAYLYFVLDYCSGGELFFHLSREKRFSQSRTRFYSAEIVLALEYLHLLHIVYQDLKPENVMLTGSGHIKLTDFGLSKEGVDDELTAKNMTQCGTPEYLAPEILRRQNHGKAVDWYALGALVFEMLIGVPPFYARDVNAMYMAKLKGTLEYPQWISAVAKSLIQGLLQRDPRRRLGSGRDGGANVKRHPFFRGFLQEVPVDWNALLERRVQPPFVPKLRWRTDVRYFERMFTDRNVSSEFSPVAVDTPTAPRAPRVLGASENDRVFLAHLRGFDFHLGDDDTP